MLIAGKAQSIMTAVNSMAIVWVSRLNAEAFTELQRGASLNTPMFERCRGVRFPCGNAPHAGLSAAAKRDSPSEGFGLGSCRRIAYMDKSSSVDTIAFLPRANEHSRSAVCRIVITASEVREMQNPNLHYPNVKICSRPCVSQSS
jgi:hypothetical protein